MNNEYHAIIVNKSLVDESFIDQLNVIGKKEGSWVLYKISVAEAELEKTIKEIQSNMAEGSWYFHFYNSDGSRMIVVFKDKSFETDSNPENWTEILEYGKSLNIPAEQLDFVPNNFSDEKF